MEKRLNTLFVGQKLVHLPAVDSTNNYTIDLIRQNDIMEGTVVSSDFQTFGKGQRQKIWISEKRKNALLSIAVKPSFLDIKDQFYLSKITSLALVKTLMAFNVGGVSIKWPNDIMIENAKVAGVLIENVIKPNQLNWAVIGIGLNINQLEFPLFFPEAISMKLATGRSLVVEEVQERFLTYFEQYYLQLKNKNYQAIDFAYLKSLYKKGMRVRFKTRNNEEKLLLIREVDRQGLLVCNNEQQQEEKYALHELQLAKTVD